MEKNMETTTFLYVCFHVWPSRPSGCLQINGRMLETLRMSAGEWDTEILIKNSFGFMGGFPKTKTLNPKL